MSPFRTQCLLACVAGLIGITARAGDLGPADPETGRDHWAFTALLQTTGGGTELVRCGSNLFSNGAQKRD